MSHQPRRVFLPPGVSRKRKEMESGFYRYHNPSSNYNNNNMQLASSGFKTATEPDSSNRLLAGYMAYEFLTKGTLFGQRFDPALAEALPFTCAGKLEAEPAQGSYPQVASIVMKDGTHVPGVVNPTQLGRWIRM